MESNIGSGVDRRRDDSFGVGLGALTPEQSFAFQEYTESANAYFKGVEIGYTVLKYFITVNAVFFTLISASASGNSVLDGFSSLVVWVPVIAILVGALLWIVIPHYFDHLENCRSRCQEIEEYFGGLLFTRLGSVSNAGNKRGVSARRGLQGVVVVVGVLWLIVVWSHLRESQIIPPDVFQRVWALVGSFLG